MTNKFLSKEQLSVANHSGFFRDPFVWKTLKKEVIPKLVIRRGKWGFFNEKKFKQVKLTEPLKVLVVGCSSGDEAYSVGIIFNELGLPCQIDAVDLDKKRINEAKAGVFDKSHLIFVSQSRLKKFFEKNKEFFKIKKDLFNIDFQVADVLEFLEETTTPDEFSNTWIKQNYDLIFCRNVLFYFNQKEAESLIKKIVNCTRMSGFIVFGTDDPLPSHPDLSMTCISERIFQVYANPIKHYPSKAFSLSGDNWYHSRKYTEKEPALTAETKIVGVGGAGIITSKFIAEKAIPKNALLLAAGTNICPLIIAAGNLPWICFGRKIACGMGCGGSTKFAEAVFRESQKELEEFIDLKNTKTLFLIAGFGGGTGTVTATRLAETAKKQGVTVCSIITKPLNLENRRLKAFNKYYPQITKNSNLTCLLKLEEISQEAKKNGQGIIESFKISEKIIYEIFMHLNQNQRISQYNKKLIKIKIRPNKVYFNLNGKEHKINKTAQTFFP